LIAGRMKSIAETEASPTKSILKDLETFRSLLKASVKAYSARLDEEIAAVSTRVEALGEAEKLPAGKLRDLRDMMTLLRHVDIKAEKGRRKDLKKLDSVVGDLSLLVENW